MQDIDLLIYRKPLDETEMVTYAECPKTMNHLSVGPYLPSHIALFLFMCSLAEVSVPCTRPFLTVPLRILYLSKRAAPNHH